MYPIYVLKKVAYNKALNMPSSSTTNTKSLTISQLNEAMISQSIQGENDLWLVVIVFSYVFGLFLVFIIIWLVWYGMTMKKRQNFFQRHSKRINPTVRSNSGGLLSSGHNFMHYDYNTQSSPSQPVYNNSGIGQMGCSGVTIGSSRYSPGPIRNPAFNDNGLLHSESFMKNKCTSDDLSTHSASFVHSYHNRHRL